MAFQAPDIVSHLTLETNKYVAALNASAVQAQAFARENSTLAEKGAAAWNIFGNVGKVMTAGVTVPVVTGFAAAGKAAIGFESSFAGVRKTVDASEAEYAALNQQLLEMSRIVPKSADALAGIMEAGGQLGVPQEQLEKFTRTIADLSVATNLSEEAGAAMLAQYANVMGMDISNIDRLGSVIVDLGNNTATTEADIVNMAQRLSGAGSILGLTNAQVMGLSATMASLGINAEAGGSAASRVLQRMLQDVRAGGDGLKVYAKTANMSEEAFSAAFGADPLQALIAFIDGLAQVNETGGDVYGILDELNLSDIRITDTLLRMTGAQGQLEKNISMANEAWDENIALSKEAEQRYGTTESKIQLAKNSIREAGISIGNSFLPIIGEAAEGVAGLANQFSNLDEEQQKQIITGAGVAAGIGPAMMLIKGLVGVISGPGGMVAGLALAAGGVIALNAALESQAYAEFAENMGGVVLSADEVKAVIAEGFGAPAIDTKGISDAKDAAEAARAKFVELQEQLAKDVYLLSMGVKSMTPEEMQLKVSGVIGAAQTYLDLEQNAAKMTITAYYGEAENGEQNTLLSGLDSYMDDLRTQLTAKGEELGGALTEAMVNGASDEEIARLAAELNAEINKITAQAAIMQSQSDMDVFVAKARHGGVSLDTIGDLDTEARKVAESWQKIYDGYRDEMLNIAANQKNAGILSEAAYQEELDKIFAHHDWMVGDKDRAYIDTAWKAYGRDATSYITQDIGQAQGILNNPDATLEDIKWVGETADNARMMMEKLGPLFDAAKGVKERMGTETPEYINEMIGVFEQLETFADLSTVAGLASTDNREAVKNMEVVDPSSVDASMDALNKTIESSVKEAKDTAETGGKESAETFVESANQAANEEEAHIGDTVTTPIEGLPEKTGELGTESGMALVESANQGANDTENNVGSAVVEPLEGLPASMGEIGNNAMDSLLAPFAKGEKRAFSAGAGVGSALERGSKHSLGIASPSAVFIDIADNVHGTLVERLDLGLPKLNKMSETLGSGIATSTLSGYNAAFQGPREKRESAGSGMTFLPGDAWAAMDQIPETTSTKRSSGGGGKSTAAEPVIDYSAGINATLARVAEEQASLQTAINGYNSEYERLLQLTGAWRPYYDKTELDKQIEAITEKYEALIDAEQEGYEALSEAEQSARSKAHSKLMQQLQQGQRDEIAAIQNSYKLQSQLTTDYLSAQADALSAAFAAKREDTRAEDYEKSIADLEKRIRQTRSARERRELTEELERMQRDEALRLEEQELNQALQGINALKTAASAGVIGLGDILGDKSLPTGTGGLRAVQGITAEQLESVLQTITERQAQQGGNHFTVDLTGVAIRDDSDIDRIIEGFNQEMRSILRGLK